VSLKVKVVDPYPAGVLRVAVEVSPEDFDALLLMEITGRRGCDLCPEVPSRP
jgi:hypothetical protein